MTSFYKFCANINAAIKRNQVSIKVPRSKITDKVVGMLAADQQIVSFKHLNNGYVKQTEIFLAYKDGCPVLKQIVSVSRPGRRVYVKYAALAALQAKLFWATANKHSKNSRFSRVILSTSLGLVTENFALQHKIGGEVLCRIFV